MCQGEYAALTVYDNGLGLSAEDLDRTLEPFLIVLDMIMLPGMKGRETYERIIKMHPNQKAIIASGFAETKDVKPFRGWVRRNKLKSLLL